MFGRDLPTTVSHNLNDYHKLSVQSSFDIFEKCTAIFAKYLDLYKNKISAFIPKFLRPNIPMKDASEQENWTGENVI